MSDGSGQHRWHRRARHALRRSLRLRLLLVFLLLAMGIALIFLVGSQRALGNGWRQAVAPLLGDYIDRLAADIGTPPSVERARALAARLPIAIRIEGPVVRWRSEADTNDDPRTAWGQRWRGDDAAVQLSDGFDIHAAVGGPADHDPAVKTLLHKLGGPVDEVQFGRHMRVLFLKTGQHARDDPLAHIDDRNDAQMPADGLPLAVQTFAEPVGQIQQLACVGEHDAARFGEAHRVGVAADQRGTDLRFQRGQMATQSRLCHAQNLRRR